MSYKIMIDERNALGNVPVFDDEGVEFCSFDPHWPIARMSHVANLIINAKSIAAHNGLKSTLSKLELLLKEHCNNTMSRERDTGAFIFHTQYAEGYAGGLTAAIDLLTDLAELKQPKPKEGME